MWTLQQLNLTKKKRKDNWTNNKNYLIHHASRSLTNNSMDWVMPKSWILCVVCSSHSTTLCGKLMAISKLRGQSSCMKTNLYSSLRASCRRNILWWRFPFGSLISNLTVSSLDGLGSGVSSNSFLRAARFSMIAFKKEFLIN